ncbi:peptidoglycan -binding protein [Kordiimonas gwangyangensis]|uniref:peptidoglycan -binding protein n=1 Tax=Kordiimonas gwangyangensis TaxID=288022 RepID=UPI00036CFA0C|nr:peptidoglycan -binding protein [Kordiimonas gwangyangensis]
MIGSRRRIGGGAQDNSWPGFVDALSTLLLVIIFLLSMFVLAQFFLGQALSGRDQALAELRGQVAQLGNLLKMEQQANDALRDSMAELSASLTAANKDRDELSASLDATRSELSDSAARLLEMTEARERFEAAAKRLEEQYGTAASELADERNISAQARAEVARLQRNITALQEQLSRLEAALQASEERDRRNQAVIVDMGRRLNRALASKVEELAGYRSEFFGRLKEVLSSRPEIRIEGDRFVFASELLFSSGSAELGPEGRAEMRKFAETLMAISREIPAELNWILRVDGHTDKRPISTAQYKNNWELSAARAISVVEFLISVGVPAERLAATGFGEFQPIDPADNIFAYSRNRRIEMRLTQR